MRQARHARRNVSKVLRVGVSAALIGAPFVAAATAVAAGSGPRVAVPTLRASLPGAAVFARPATGTFLVDGRAWGHGIGMSQEGAIGAARIGISATAILAHYYPHTVLATSPDRSIKVWLQDAGRNLSVTATPGLQLVVPSPTAAISRVLPAGFVAWRLVPTGATTATAANALTIQALASRTGTWHAWIPPGAKTALVPAGTAFAPAAAGTKGAPTYRGLTGVRVENVDGSTSTEPGPVTLVRESTGWPVVVVTTDLDVYVRAVVAQEIGSGSPAAAQQAQAVAARTYAMRSARDSAAVGRPFAICDSTDCQAFPGIASGTVSAGPIADQTNLYAGSDAAVAATAGKILTYGGTPINAMFAAANGGFTRSGGTPYLPAQADPWDGLTHSASHAWTAILPVSAIEANWPGIGKLTRMQVVGRDGHGDLGGRATSVVLDFCTTTACTQVTTSPNAVASLYDWPGYWNGLRSSWWLPRTQQTTSVSLAHVITAAKTDPSRPGAGIFPNDTMVVQRALLAAGVMPAWSVDGSYGPVTTKGYASWQVKCGLVGKAVTGIPDQKSLTLMGQQYGFTVTP